MQWVDGPDKTGSDDVGHEDLGVKPDEDQPVVKRGAPQLNVQELELEQQPASQDLVEETKETLSKHEKVTKKALSERKQELRVVLSDPEEETQEASSNPEGET